MSEQSKRALSLLCFNFCPTITATVYNFQDKNDNSPIFTSVVRPVTIEDSSSIGSLVQTALAVDADATPPNNRVRYKLVGRGKASIYFHVEPDTGAVRVRDDLRKETDSEYTVSSCFVFFFL